MHGWEGFRPFNFFMRPMISPLGVNVDPRQFALAAPMESDQTKWIRSRCINICDLEDKRKYKITTDPMESVLSPSAILGNDFRYRAHTYIQHPESKALAPDGSLCKGDTRGLLFQKNAIAAGKTAKTPTLLNPSLRAMTGTRNAILGVTGLRLRSSSAGSRRSESAS